MKSIKLAVLIVCSMILKGCTPQPKLDNFDASAWVKDTKGCNGTRISPAEILFEQRDKLLGIGDKDLISYLGKPDAQDLDERNVKYLYYYYAPGNQCKGSDKKGESYIRFRLNSISLVSEIIKL